MKNFKLITLILVVSSSLFISSCTSKTEHFTASDYDRILRSEFQQIKDEAPGTELYESFVETDSACHSHIVMFINVYRDKDDFTFVFHDPDTVIVTEFTDTRNDNVGISPDTLKVSLKSIFDMFSMMEEHGMSANGKCNISLYSINGRKGVIPPFYAITTDRETYYVDATTGEVEVQK